jgi:demethylmenaquinone methyltransferase/2-methoxy-6-polyprenyl-1,4-benzoquinol methylase
MQQARQVRAMFGRIAGCYDLLNRVLSLGIDRRWRRAMVAVAGETDGRFVVDACCGTGDVALEFAGRGARVLGVDFTPEMLARAELKGRRRSPGTVFAHGDALRLPVRDGSADLCTNAFGIRNVEDRRAGLREMRRVLRPDGRAVILEFTLPPGRLLGLGYRLYFTRVLPAVGRLVSRDGDAYSYLPRTVLAWPSPGEFQREMEREGFVECGHRLLSRGIACLHWGKAPGRSSA